MSMHLTYDQRIEMLSTWFKNDVVKRFAPPRDADPRLIAHDTINSVNRHLPSQMNHDQMLTTMERILRIVIENARTRTLPPAYDFVKAAQSAAPTGVRAASGAAFKPALMVEKAIHAGAPISEFWLRGRQREELLAQTSITDADLAPYDASMNH